MQPADTDTLTERLRALASEAIAGTDLYVVDVAVRGREGSRVVEVYVDADTGAGLGAIAEVSNRLSFLLDTEDPVSGPYTLNVSSPGADRPLALPRQYPKHVGRTLRVSYQADAGDPGEEVTLTGPLVGAGPDAITVQTREGHDVQIPYAAIREARVVLPW